MNDIIIPQSFIGLLYEDGVFNRQLQPGKYKRKNGLFDIKIRTVERIDMRERSLVIKGQEILTRDKVAIRVSLLVYFRVINPELAAHAVEDYSSRIYEDVQLAARRFLASRNLEAILSDRNEISDAVRSTVSDAALSYGVEVNRADVKDLVFPGNLRAIMNQVLETDRRSEAKLIQARKDIETATLRAKADNEAEMARLEAQRARAHLEIEAQKELAVAEHECRKIELQSLVDEAALVAKHPAMLKIRELQTMSLMANNGAKFVINKSGPHLLEKECED